MEIIKRENQTIEFKNNDKIYKRKVNKRGFIRFKNEMYFPVSGKLVKVPERFGHLDEVESYGELECYLQMIVDKFQKYNVPDEKSNSISYISTYSGKIEMFKKETAQHYYMQRYMPLGIKVGTAFWWHLDDKIKEELLSEIYYVLSLAVGVLTVDYSNVFVFETAGSNFSRYAIAV